MDILEHLLEKELKVSWNYITDENIEHVAKGTLAKYESGYCIEFKDDSEPLPIELGTSMRIEFNYDDLVFK